MIYRWHVEEDGYKQRETQRETARPRAIPRRLSNPRRPKRASESSIIHKRRPKWTRRHQLRLAHSRMSRTALRQGRCVATRTTASRLLGYLPARGRAHGRYLCAQPQQQVCLMLDVSTDRMIDHLAMYLACDDQAVRFCFFWIRDSVGHIWRVYQENEWAQTQAARGE
jgi:hypothetical protein